MEPENSPSGDLRSLNDISEPNNEYNQLQQYPRNSSTPKIAGILLLFVGMLIILHWIYIIASPDFIDTIMNTGVYNSMNITSQDLATVFNFCGIIAIGLSLFTIVGGLLAFQRRMFWLACIGGIVGIFAIAPLFLFIPNILSLVGVILIIRSRKDFQ